MGNKFTPEEIEVLKEIAHDKIRMDLINLCDSFGKKYPQRNRYSEESQEEFSYTQR